MPLLIWLIDAGAGAARARARLAAPLRRARHFILAAGGPHQARMTRYRGT